MPYAVTESDKRMFKVRDLINLISEDVVGRSAKENCDTISYNSFRRLSEKILEVTE